MSYMIDIYVEILFYLLLPHQKNRKKFTSLIGYRCSLFNYLQQHTLTCMLPHGKSLMQSYSDE